MFKSLIDDNTIITLDNGLKAKLVEGVLFTQVLDNKGSHDHWKNTLLTLKDYDILLTNTKEMGFSISRLEKDYKLIWSRNNKYGWLVGMDYDEAYDLLSSYGFDLVITEVDGIPNYIEPEMRYRTVYVKLENNKIKEIE